MILKTLLLLCLMSLKSTAHTFVPTPIDQIFPGQEPLGSGALKVGIFKLYDIDLWAKNPTCAQNINCTMAIQTRQNWGAGHKKLVSKTLEKMQKITPHMDPVSVEKYRGYLEKIYPDSLEPSDVVQIILEEKQGEFYIHFYHRPHKETSYRLRATLKDIGFAQHFFGIWLNEKTSYPKLRNLLLGKDQSSKH